MTADWVGWDNVLNCEIDTFCNTVTGFLFPECKQYGDIKQTDFSGWRGKIDILTGGFPCQPYSVAGKRKGTEDDRHLWPEMLRAVREIRPRWVVGENVPGFIDWNGGMVFEQVCAELEAEGYEVVPFVLPACGVNAPHRRDRVWIVAHGSNAGIESLREPEKRSDEPGIAADNNIGDGQEIGLQAGRQEYVYRTEGTRDVTNANLNIGCERGLYATGSEAAERYTGTCGSWFYRTSWENFPTQSPVCSGNDGLSSESHSEPFSKEHSMDRTDLILRCLNEGRIITDPNSGKIFSKMIHGYVGELIELNGSDCNGYVVHSLKYNGIKKQVKAHQVIWMSVYGSYDKEKYQIDHINRNKKDNRISNLRLVIPKENVANSERYRGQFTDTQKDEMFLLHTDGMSFKELAEHFGCSKSRVQQIFSEHKFNRLDGVAIYKAYGKKTRKKPETVWREESIKGFGNAIVPQVALQIFKTIEQYDILQKQEDHLQ